MDSQTSTTHQKQSQFLLFFQPPDICIMDELIIFDISLCVNNLQTAGQLPTPAVASILTCSQSMLFSVKWDTRVKSPWTRLVDFVFQQLHNQLEEENVFTGMQRDPAKGFVVWIFSSGTVNRTNCYVTSISCYSCVLLSFCNTQGRFSCVCVYFWDKERKSLKSKIISPLSHPAATINSQVIREHASVRDSNRYFVLMFIECIFWVLHLKHWGSKSVKNCAPTSIIYF